MSNKTNPQSQKSSNNYALAHYLFSSRYSWASWLIYSP